MNTEMNPTGAAPAPDNSIVTFLQHQRAGAAMDDLSIALRQVMSAVKATHKKGKVTLEITVEPTAGAHLQFYDVVTVKAPQPARECGVFYLGENGELSRQDPRQREFRFGVTTGGASAPVAEVKPAVGQ